MGAPTRDCAGCKRPVNAAIAVCPFCGHRAGPSEVVNAPHPFGVGRSSPVFERSAASPGAGASPKCPRCSAAAGANPVAVQVWKGAHHWNPGIRLFHVLSRNLPGMCSECAGWLHGRRRRASLVMVAPFLFLAALAGTGSMFFVVVTGLYGLHLVRSGSYGFADSILYGEELEVLFKDGLPHHPGVDPAKESVRFPAGIAHAVARIALACTGGFALALAVGVLGAAMAHSGPSDEEIESLLSRPKIVWISLSPGSETWATTDVHGDHTATAYTSWEALPPGAAIQISPHDAFERALSVPSIEAIQFDPGPEVIVVKKERFEDLKLRLPPWATPVKVVTK